MPAGCPQLRWPAHHVQRVDRPSGPLPSVLKDQQARLDHSGPAEAIKEGVDSRRGGQHGCRGCSGGNQAHWAGERQSAPDSGSDDGSTERPSCRLIEEQPDHSVTPGGSTPPHENRRQQAEPRLAPTPVPPRPGWPRGRGDARIPHQDAKWTRGADPSEGEFTIAVDSRIVERRDRSQF